MERITREIYLYFDGERRVNRARFDPALRTLEGIVVEKLDRVDAFFVRVHQRRKLVCECASFIDNPLSTLTFSSPSPPLWRMEKSAGNAFDIYQRVIGEVIGACSRIVVPEGRGAVRNRSFARGDGVAAAHVDAASAMRSRVNDPDP